jgi:hypothetical protein
MSHHDNSFSNDGGTGEDHKMNIGGEEEEGIQPANEDDFIYLDED